MNSTVLDASAILALLNQEAGSARVAAAVTVGAVVSAVNLAEVVGKLADSGVPGEAIRTALIPLGLEVVPLDMALAYRTGLLRPSARSAGLSLGDRACLALAQHLTCQS